MKLFKSSVIALVAAGLMGLAVCGCHTVKGAGQDIEHGGKAIEKSADKAMTK
jgi:predicted small secreted protein